MKRVTVEFTLDELWAVTFAVKADLETVLESEPDEFGDDSHHLQSALNKLEEAELEADNG